MPILTEKSSALMILTGMLDEGTNPVLSSTELEGLLDDAKRASIWTAATSFDFGAVVIPTAAKRNGHRYKLMKLNGGVASGATEPNWSDTREATVTDGNLTWQEAGRDYDSLWDLDLAAHRGWLLKAGKANDCVNFSEDGQSFDESDVYAHCIQQAAKYQPIGVA